MSDETLGQFKQIMPPGAKGTPNPDYETEYAEEKLDGDRRIAQFCSPNPLIATRSCNVRFTGRRVSDVNGLLVEKTECLPHLHGQPNPFLFHEAPNALLGTVLDGEMIVDKPGARSKDVTSIIGSKPEKAIAKQQERGWLVYVVFDCLFYKGEDIRQLPLKTRREYLKKVVTEWNNPYVRLVRNNVDEGLTIDQFLDTIWKREFPGEGIIKKFLPNQYPKSGDCRTWIKVKREETVDVVIMGFDPPEQFTEKTETYLDENNVKKKRVLEVSESRLFKNGWIGAIRFGQYKPYEPGDVIDARDPKGNLLVITGQDTVPPTFGIPRVKDGKTYLMTYCGSCSGMDDATRKDISEHPEKYLGRVMEILANEREDTGKFRHPRMIQFRDDKNDFQCIWGEK